VAIYFFSLVDTENSPEFTSSSYMTTPDKLMGNDDWSDLSQDYGLPDIDLLDFSPYLFTDASATPAPVYIEPTTRFECLLAFNLLANDNAHKTYTE